MKKTFVLFGILTVFLLSCISLSAKTKKKIINLKNQKINPVKIFLEYAYILFELNEYFESIKYYEEYFEYLSKEELLRLYEIYKKVNKLDKAKEIKEHFIL